MAATTIMGLVCGIAYSASYQMVSRFAKKNTISLGLGCVGSGIIVLFLEVGLQVGIHPSKLQSILLYEFTSGAQGSQSTSLCLLVCPSSLLAACVQWRKAVPFLYEHILAQASTPLALFLRPLAGASLPCIFICGFCSKQWS